MNNELTKEALEEEFFAGVMVGSIDRVIATLEQGVNLNCLTPKGNNALYVAATRKRREMFEWLLEVKQKGISLNVNNQNQSGATTLFECVEEGDMLFYLQKLIDKGADVNIPTYDGMTPLIQACSDKKIEEVNILAKSPGIEINAKIPISYTTAFLMASAQSSMQAISILVEAGADQNAIDSEGKNALINTIYQNRQFMKKGELKEHNLLCKFLIEVCDNIDYVAPSGMSAFFAASFTRQKELAKLLIEKNVNVNVIHEVGIEGKLSALHIWCKSGDPEMVELVLKAGAKLGIPDSEGNLPESYGFLLPSLYQIMLDSNADVNAIYYQGKDKKKLSIPSLTSVINNGDKNIEIVEEMIKRGAKVVYDEPEFDGFDPLFSSIVGSHLKISKLLLETGKIDLNRHLTINKNYPPLSVLSLLAMNLNSQQYSSYLEQKKVLEKMIEGKEINDKNGVVSDIVNDDNIEEIKESLAQITQLEKSLEHVKKELFDLLILKGAKVNNENTNGHTEIFFAAKPMFAQWLKDAGANCFHTDKNGLDVLYTKIIEGDTEMIGFWKEEFQKENHPTLKNILYQLAFEDFATNPHKQNATQSGILAYLNNEDIKKVFDPTVKPEEKPQLFIDELLYEDEDGNTPLIVACANNNGTLASLYKALGADVNKANHLGETALMHAINVANEGLVDFLVKRGADITATTHEGKSVIEMAKELNNKAIIKFVTETVVLPEEVKKNIKP
jgi:ankyrin repeat protein